MGSDPGRPFDRVVGPFESVGELVVALALSQVGVREVNGSNRGLEVDYYRETGGGKRMRAGEKGPPWCAYFRSALLVEADRRLWELPYRIRSGAARHHWQRVPTATSALVEGTSVELVYHVRRGAIFEQPDDVLLGGAMVRARGGKPHHVPRIAGGQQVQGHVATVVGVDREPGAEALLCVGGNSSGVGHSRTSGAVAWEIYRPGTPQWECIVGVSTLEPVL